MKMNKKGFTLIELLAVIVILAIVALIATPIVLNVIDTAREKAATSAIAGYADAIKLARIQYIFDEEGEEPDWSTAVPNTIVVSGEKPTCTTAKLDEDKKVVLAGCTIPNNTSSYSYADGKVTKE